MVHGRDVAATEDRTAAKASVPKYLVVVAAAAVASVDVAAARPGAGAAGSRSSDPTATPSVNPIGRSEGTSCSGAGGFCAPASETTLGGPRA